MKNNKNPRSTPLTIEQWKRLHKGDEVWELYPFGYMVTWLLNKFPKSKDNEVHKKA